VFGERFLNASNALNVFRCWPCFTDVEREADTKEEWEDNIMVI
jgi:hypothetical protein